MAEGAKCGLGVPKVIIDRRRGGESAPPEGFGERREILDSGKLGEESLLEREFRKGLFCRKLAEIGVDSDLFLRELAKLLRDAANSGMCSMQGEIPPISLQGILDEKEKEFLKDLDKMIKK